MTEPPPSLRFHGGGIRKRLKSIGSTSSCSLESRQEDDSPDAEQRDAERRILKILAEVPYMMANDNEKTPPPKCVPVPSVQSSVAKVAQKRDLLPSASVRSRVSTSPQPNKPTFVCDVEGCEWSGRTRTAWRSHRIQKHPQMKKINRPIICSFCPDDNQVNLGNMLRYRRHLLVDHGLHKFTLQKETLPNKEVLREWMDRVQHEHSVKFVTWGSAETHRGGIRVRRYYCSMSGMVTSKNDSKKFGTFCTCTLKVSEKPDGFLLEYCLVHSGHDEQQYVEISEVSDKDQSTTPVATPTMVESPPDDLKTDPFEDVLEADIPIGYFAERNFEAPLETSTVPVYHDLKPIAGRWADEYPLATEAPYFPMEEDDDGAGELSLEARNLSERLSTVSSVMASSLPVDLHEVLITRIRELSELIDSLQIESSDRDAYSPKRRKLIGNSL
uniref:C2H2-type domain-containing protein n=1 Tax=Steinernema glaseri TaxID=37863 RepID=A0A1I7Y653_9BILA